MKRRDSHRSMRRVLLIGLAPFAVAPLAQPAKVFRVDCLSNDDEVVNLKAAKILGITMPQSILVRTDSVIE